MPSPVDLALADALAIYTEQPPGSNITKFGDRFFGPGSRSPWCAEMVSCNTRDAGADGPWNASVGFWQAEARRRGRLVDLGGALDAIRAGLCVAVGFEWQRDAWPDHIGWLLGSPAPSTISTVEGNTPGADRRLGDIVTLKTRPTTSVAFYGVVVPAGNAAPAPTLALPPVQPTHPAGPILPPWMVLTWQPRKRPGFTNHGDRVAVLQQFFQRLGGGWDPGGVDGIIGPKTNDIIGRFQRSKFGPTGVDYEVGQRTWRAAFGG